MLRMNAVPREVKNPLGFSFCGLAFSSPIVLLSGCVGFGEEYTRVEGFSNRDAGAIVLKGTTGKPPLGNPPRRRRHVSGGRAGKAPARHPAAPRVRDAGRDAERHRTTEPGCRPRGARG